MKGKRQAGVMLFRVIGYGLVLKMRKEENEAERK